MDLNGTIRARNLDCGYGKTKILANLSFELKKGEILCVLGPNGSGKTTLFRTLLRFLPPLGGAVFMGDENIARWPRRLLASKIAYVPQAHAPPFPYTVEEIILMGRTVRFAGRPYPRREDYEKAGALMELLGLEHLRNRPYTDISGGERQLALIARALAQEPEYLVMDEPASGLDFGNQMKLLKHISALRDSGVGILMTSHHPDHVFLCDARVLLIQGGGRYAAGPCDDILTEENLQDTYGIKMRILRAAAPDGRMIRTCIADFAPPLTPNS
jgi:iron complex transport system ATP-binding protein